MLKEVFVTGALVVATAFTPSASAQGPPVASNHLTSCSSAHTKPCKWLEGTNKKCLWCKSKHGGYTRSYCEPKSAPGKAPEAPKKEGILCKGDLDENNMACTRCVSLKTDKITFSNCKGEKAGDPAP
ncbi:hypothetical protein AB0F17_17805 [Nonomuraea sp. NPDC026600]|uniref:hypothetical protein n=1 Tax=Nonomuraea sp. NPDC026600 TaxID=3155363 RepID=UPI0033E74BC5